MSAGRTEYLNAPPQTGADPACQSLHPAMPDAELTVQALQRAQAAEHVRDLWTALGDLDTAVGIAARPVANRAGNALDQEPRC